MLILLFLIDFSLFPKDIIKDVSKDFNKIEYQKAYNQALIEKKGLIVVIDSNKPPGLESVDNVAIVVRLQYFDNANDGDVVFSGNRKDHFERLETVKRAKLKETPLPIPRQNISR